MPVNGTRHSWLVVPLMILAACSPAEPEGDGEREVDRPELLDQGDLDRQRLVELLDRCPGVTPDDGIFISESIGAAAVTQAAEGDELGACDTVKSYVDGLRRMADRD